MTMLVLGSKIFLLHCFFNPFLQLAAGKKDSKNGAARTFFGPSYFDLTLYNLLDEILLDCTFVIVVLLL